MHGSALRTGTADARLSDLGGTPALAQRAFQRSQFKVGLGGGGHLLTHQVRTLAVEPPELDHEASEVTELQLAKAAQVTSSAAHLRQSGARPGATVGGKRIHGAHRRVGRV